MQCLHAESSSKRRKILPANNVSGLNSQRSHKQLKNFVSAAHWSFSLSRSFGRFTTALEKQKYAYALVLLATLGI
jgi:hypothetical protein